MIGPAVNPPQRGTAAFHALVDEAARHGAAHRETAVYALDMGVNPDQIVDYVRGVLSGPAREEMMNLLVSVPWAMGRVVALVKAKREPGSLGARILATEGEVDPAAFGIASTGDRGADMANLLDRA